MQAVHVPRLLLCVLATAIVLGCGGKREAPRVNVLLITVDALRADRLGAYGYHLDTSPTIDRLAERGVRFADCTVQWPKTWPSIASMMTGRYPKTTGLSYRRRKLPRSATVVADVFSDAGYATGAVVANFNLGRTMGFDGGFDFFVESWEERWQESAQGEKFRNWPGRVKRFTNATLVNEQALTWLESLPRQEPYFLWVHFMEPHGPYVPPEEYASLFEGAHEPEPVPLEKIHRYQWQYARGTRQRIRDLGFYKAQYDREIRYLDDEIGRLLKGVEAIREGQETLIVFTADHGESLGEHDYYLEHGMLPYQPSAHVPAIVVRDGVLPAGRTIEQPIGLIDLSATLVELAGGRRSATSSAISEPGRSKRVAPCGGKPGGTMWRVGSSVTA